MGSLEPCPTHMDCFQHKPIEIGEQSRCSRKLDRLIFIQVAKYTKEQIRPGKSVWEKNENPMSPSSESGVRSSLVQQVSISSIQSLFSVYFFLRAISTQKSSLIGSSWVYPLSSIIQWFRTTIIVTEPRSPSSDRCPEAADPRWAESAPTLLT
jgi:hypothetical protein